VGAGGVEVYGARRINRFPFEKKKTTHSFACMKRRKRISKVTFRHKQEAVLCKNSLVFKFLKNSAILCLFYTLSHTEC
jgi:hypothetical protein